jgi:hypothetical protein
MVGANERRCLESQRSDQRLRGRAGVRPRLGSVAAHPRTRGEEEKERGHQPEHDQKDRQCASLPTRSAEIPRNACGSKQQKQGTKDWHQVSLHEQLPLTFELGRISVSLRTRVWRMTAGSRIRRIETWRSGC